MHRRVAFGPAELRAAYEALRTHTAPEIDTPANVGFGISYKFTPDLTVGVDVTRTFYEDVAAIVEAVISSEQGVHDHEVVFQKPAGIDIFGK